MNKTIDELKANGSIVLTRIGSEIRYGRRMGRSEEQVRKIYFAGRSTLNAEG